MTGESDMVKKVSGHQDGGDAFMISGSQIVEVTLQCNVYSTIC